MKQRKDLQRMSAAMMKVKSPLNYGDYGVETVTKQKKNKSKTIGITDDSINVTVEKKDGSEKDNYITEGDKGYKRKRKRLVNKANRWMNREANRNDDKYSSFRM